MYKIYIIRNKGNNWMNTASDTRASKTPSPPIRGLVSLSERLLMLEKLAVAAFMTLLLCLILINVGTRYAGIPLYWVDEAAVYATVWLTFIGGSALTRLRLDFAVTLVSEKLSPRNAERLQALATFIAFLFAVGLVVMCWNWMDPLGIAAAGFRRAGLCRRELQLPLHGTNADAELADLDRQHGRSTVCGQHVRAHRSKSRRGAGASSQNSPQGFQCRRGGELR